jgi:hypothetical protein
VELRRQLAAMNQLVAGLSPRRLARTAGVLSLVNILLGFFAIGYVPAAIGGSGDPATMLHGIQANELLYRLGLAAHVVVTTTNIGLALITYELFKIVNRRLALLVALLFLVATAIEAASIIGQFIPLELIDSPHDSGAFTPQQVQLLGYLPSALAADGYSVYTVFFGLGYLIPFASLAWNATFIPRVFGALLAIDGFAYLFNAFASMTAPGFAGHLVPYILLPILVSEGSLCVWYLIKGVDEARWRQVAAGAASMA